MTDRLKQDFQDPKVLLQTAIQELNVFTQSEISRLEVGEDGRLIAAKETRLERVMGLARCYIGPLFSDQVRQKQEKKFAKLKQAILRLRDFIQSHSALIEKLREGDAEQALLAIQRYNMIVAQGCSSETIKYDVYNYERQRLLLDEEIKDRPIELPHAISIKYDSHSDAHPAHKMLKELSQTLTSVAVKKSSLSIHKKPLQFMIDTFDMKAIRMMQAHLSQQNSMAEILQLVKQTTLEIDEESSEELIKLRKLIETGPGFFILVTGCFKRDLCDSKFLNMPILDSFRLSFQLSHSGFPYPSQHTSWALADKWVEAYPLRADQVPFFQQVNQRKKQLTQKLLFDQALIQKSRRYANIKKEVFDQNRDLFLPLHFQLQQILKQSFLREEKDPILETFYHEVAQASSAFDVLVRTQQQLLDLFIKQPMKALEEEWLSAESNSLREGTPHEKFRVICQRFEYHRNQALKYLDPHHSQHAYILQQGMLLGKAFQSIALQYQSEKMGFSPPLLNDFERKLQACSFQQLITFMDECEQNLEDLGHEQIKAVLLNHWSRDLELFLASTVEEQHSLAVKIINELEAYFNSRFYAFHSHQFDKISKMGV